MAFKTSKWATSYALNGEAGRIKRFEKVHRDLDKSGQIEKLRLQGYYSSSLEEEDYMTLKDLPEDLPSH